MNKEQAAERARVIEVVRRNFPEVKDPARLQDDLYLLGVQCNRNAEKLCNIPNYVDQRQALREKLEKIKARHGVQFEASVSGDPRGYSLRVIMPLGDFNTWGGPAHGYGFGDV